jgi:hypothetical protein
LTDSINTTTSNETTFLSNTIATHFESEGTDLVVYVAAGAAGGIVMLFVIILILCICVYWLTYNSREPICIHTTVQQQVQLQIPGEKTVLSSVVFIITTCLHNSLLTLSDHIPHVQEESLYNNILDSQFDVVDNNVGIDQSGIYFVASVEHTISVFT